MGNCGTLKMKMDGETVATVGPGVVKMNVGAMSNVQKQMMQSSDSDSDSVSDFVSSGGFGNVHKQMMKTSGFGGSITVGGSNGFGGSSGFGGW